MKTLDIWPEFDRGTSFGNRYQQISESLRQLSSDLEVDLWTLDALWWGVADLPDDEDDELGEVVDEFVATFGLERHLQEFLRDNWQATELGLNWDIYGEPVSYTHLTLPTTPYV